MEKLTREAIAKPLTDFLSDAPAVIVVHANLFSFGMVDNPAETFLQCLLEAAGPDRTILMPTFTLSFFRERWFDAAATPSETGALSEYFRTLPDVQRTPCPLNSFAVTGPASERFMACKNNPTCWGEGSVLEALYNEDALIVGFGASLAESGSIFHYAEQQVGVPYRYFKTVQGKADFGNGTEDVVKRFYVSRRDLPTAYSFAAPMERLASEERVRRIRLGMGTIESVRAREAVDCLADMLRESPVAVLKNPQEYTAKAGQKCFAFCGSTNLDLMVQTFAETYEAATGIACRTVPIPFGQYRQHILDGESDLRAADPDYVVFLERAEDLFRPVLRGELADVKSQQARDNALETAIGNYVHTIRTARERMQSTLFVANFERTEPSIYYNADSAVEYGTAAVIRQANTMLEQALRGMPDTHIIDYASLLLRHGYDRAFGGKYWYMGKIPFSQSFAKLLSNTVVGITLALEGRTTRLIVLDLDNTLWSGVIGDDGIAGIQLGGDFPGNMFKEWQKFLKGLARRGIALAVCSKNTHEVAMDAIENHPEMVLKKDDFAAFRINWQDKGSNVASICEEVNLGPYSVMFLDDNPLEREWVKGRLPECVVPNLPADVSRWIEFLSDSPYLQAVNITDEDLKRSSQYIQRRKMNEFKASAESVDDFLRTLSMKVSIDPYAPEKNGARICQLFAKTNQFNTTTRRHSQGDLDALVRNGATVFAISLEDQFSEKEIIGTGILLSEGQDYLIDSFIMSCRVLGRRVETAALGWVVDRAKRLGFERVKGLIIETPKNAPVRMLFAEHGFAVQGNGEFVLRLDEPEKHPQVPDCITLVLSQNLLA